MDEANSEYIKIEQENGKGDSRQVVLIKASLLNSLGRAYSNYVIDTHEFLKYFQHISDEVKLFVKKWENQCISQGNKGYLNCEFMLLFCLLLFRKGLFGRKINIDAPPRLSVIMNKCKTIAYGNDGSNQSNFEVSKNV